METVEKQKSFFHRSHSRYYYKSVNDVPGLKRKRCPACTRHKQSLSSLDQSLRRFVARLDRLNEACRISKCRNTNSINGLTLTRFPRRKETFLAEFLIVADDLMAAPPEATSTDSRPEFAPALQTIVELVRRIMHADVASILGYSLIDETVRWKAASGFTVPVDYREPVFRRLGSAIALRALEQNTIGIVKGIGTSEFPENDFPVHVAEGICDMAVAPLRIVGNNSGALTAGYRRPHQFSEDEKNLLQNLAEIAAVVIDSERLVETVTAAEKIWEQTFDAIGEGILVHDASMMIRRCNARAAEMMDMDQDAVIGLSFNDAFARMFGQRAADYYLSDNHGASTVVEIQTEGGRRFLVSIFPIQQAGRIPASVVTWKDVTRLSEIQEQLGRSRRLASVGQLAAGVAHEVNNPLAAITTCAEAISRDLRHKNEAQLPEIAQWKYYLEEIVRQSLRCKEITRGLLDLTRQQPAKRILCNVNGIAKDCARFPCNAPVRMRNLKSIWMKLSVISLPTLRWFGRFWTT